MTTHIQAMIFDINKFDITSARKWLINHNYKPSKNPRYTENYIRFRLLPPRSTAKYMTMSMGDGVKAILMYT